jgi:ethanolamine utilization protein EutP (predicted NTPase)
MLQDLDAATLLRRAQHDKTTNPSRAHDIFNKKEIAPEKAQE